MKGRYLLCILLIGLSATVRAQLTVFNVSSSEITERGKLSVQQQFEISNQVESSTTATYGFGKGWEAGFNLVNLNYDLPTRHFEFNDYTDTIPYSPLLLANAQKVFELTNQLLVGLGAIAGTNISGHHRSHAVYYGYANLLYAIGFEKRYKFTAGPYIGNHAFLSRGPVAGLQAAVDAGILFEKVHLLGDWISGSHQKGRLSLGAGFYITGQLSLSLGWQRANKDGSQAGIVQLSLVPK